MYSNIIKCKCGYLSVKFNKGFWNCMSIKTFKDNYNIDYSNLKITTWKCDNCVNNWSVDNGKYKLGKEKKFTGWF